MNTRISGHPVGFEAEDGFPLAGELFEGTGNKPLVMISAATAAPARFYRAFASECVASGARAALVYDYRGVAASARPRNWSARINYKDHALLDFPAAAGFLQSIAPGHPMVGIGQSLGGFALGLSGIHDRFERYALVSVISGYLGHIGGTGIWLQMLAVGLPVAYLTRQMPKWAFGEPIASSTFIDWAGWCRNPDFLFGDPDLPEKSRFDDVTLPIRAIHASDDPWATRASIDDMLRRFSSTQIERKTVSPDDAGGPIGHLGFFNARYRQTLWPEQIDWLLN